MDVDTYWLTTTDIGEPTVHGYDAFWIAPGSPYKDMAKTVWLIAGTRERDSMFWNVRRVPTHGH